MIEGLPTLASDDIHIDEARLEAIATFVFPDGLRFPVHVTRHTPNNWAGHSDTWEIRQLYSGAPPHCQGWPRLEEKTKERRSRSNGDCSGTLN